jgi:hypothetical protein
MEDSTMTSILKNKEYSWFIYNTQKRRILSGWSYREDAFEALLDIPQHESKDCRVYSRKFLETHHRPLRTKQATAKALGIHPAHLDNHKIRYDGGKYAPGTQHNQGVSRNADSPVWYEHRRDSHGPYIALYTIHPEYIK